MCMDRTVCDHRRDEYGFFLEPVDVRVVPDYLDVVEHPMDLGTMAKKLHAGEYQTAEQFKVGEACPCERAPS